VRLSLNGRRQWARVAPPVISPTMENTLPILVADDSQALFELCGVSLLERLLRILQRLGFRRAFVFLSTAAEIVGTEVAKRSWAREKVVVHVVSRATGPLTPQVGLEQGPSERFVLIPASIYCDSRFLDAL